jgi:hypothetical protein
MGVPNLTYIECCSIKIVGAIHKKCRYINPWMLIIAAVCSFSGCDALSPDTYWSSGDYELIAIDTKGQMMARLASELLFRETVPLRLARP